MNGDEESGAQWAENLALGLGVANAALSALTGGTSTTTSAVVYEEPSDWDKYGPWFAAGAGVLLLAVLIRR